MLRTLRRTRFLIFLLCLLLAATFTCGILAAHFMVSWLDIAFLVLSVVLAVASLVLRCFLDSQVRGPCCACVNLTCPVLPGVL